MIDEGLSIEEEIENEDAATQILTANRQSESSANKFDDVIDISVGRRWAMIIGSKKFQLHP